MRVASIIGLSGLLLACDGDIQPAPEIAASEAVQSERFAEPPVGVPPVEDGLGFGPSVTLGDVDCFASVDRDGDVLILAVRGEHGRIELLDGSGTRIEKVAHDGAPRRRVSACALSLDPKGQPEIVVASTLGEAAQNTGETLHMSRVDGAWKTSTVTRFAASQVAFNARSPRGSELVAVDAASAGVHATLVDGSWHERALPLNALTGPGVRAVAVVADSEGRSHFALGADYYGDRGGQYVFWPSNRAAVGQPSGAVAIVLDPADPDQLPQIIHVQAERAPGRGELTVSRIYRTVIGPDSALTSLWIEGSAVTGYTRSFAPYGRQLAARIDEDGYLHTISATLEQRSAGSTWGLDYTHDRGGAPTHTQVPDVRATGPIAFSGADRLLASDHGRLVSVTRTSALPAAEPAEIPAPASSGAVDRCDAGFEPGRTTVLREMAGLSAVALAPARSGELHALEWALDRGQVRQTRGDASGWTTSDVTPWQLDTMSAGRSTLSVDATGRDHLVWPEAGGLAHWTRRDGRWARTQPALHDVIGTAELAHSKNEVWLSAIHRPAGEATLSVSRFIDGRWDAPLDLDVDGVPEAHTLVEGAPAPTLLFVERPSAGAEASLVLATHDGARFVRRELGLKAAEILGVRAIKTVDGVVGVVVVADEGEHYDILAFRLGNDGSKTELGRWGSVERPGDRALAAIRTLDGTMIVWNSGAHIEGAHVAHGARPVVNRSTLTVPAGAVLWTGSATREGRLVAATQTRDGVQLIGEACAR